MASSRQGSFDRIAALSLFSIAIGCTGTIAGSPGTGDATGGGDGGNGSVGSTGSGGSGTGSGGDSSTGSGGTASQPPSAVDDLLSISCPSVPPALPAPTARLSMAEYRRTLADLFKGVTLPTLSTPTDTKIGAFDSLVAQQNASSGYMDAFHDNAKAVAVAAMAATARWSPCTASQDAKTCAYAIISDFGKRALRRPLDADETVRYQAFYDASSTSYGADVAKRMLLEAFLQTPSFLYRVELGTDQGAATGERRLTPWELASRLSYLFLDSMPDADLLTAAEGGGLDSDSGVESQVRRLLASASARIAVTHFNDQLLELDKIGNLSKAANVFAGYSDATTGKLHDATEKFIDHSFWETGTLTDLLTEPKAFVDSTVGPIYGITNATTALTISDVSPVQRAGLLTQAGLLAALATDTRDSPVFRGVYVLDRLLCSAPPPPPAGAINAPQQPGTVVTTRDKFEISHTGGTCAACHTQIDGIGFAFEHYDAVGRWRDSENGAPINATGKIDGLSPSIDSQFDGAIDLSSRLAKSAMTRDCMAANWVAYSAGVIRDQLEACSLQPIVRRFADKKLNFQELLVALATSPAFRSIKTPAL